MKATVLFVVGMMALPIAASAARLRGRVYEAQPTKPGIAGVSVEVTLKHGTAHATTNGQGAYHIDKLPDGETITAVYLADGYVFHPTTVPITLKEDTVQDVPMSHEQDNTGYFVRLAKVIYESVQESLPTRSLLERIPFGLPPDKRQIVERELDRLRNDSKK